MALLEPYIYRGENLIQASGSNSTFDIMMIKLGR